MHIKGKTAAALLALALTLSAASCGKEPEYAAFNFDLSDYVRVADYKGVAVEDINTSVTDEDVQGQVLIARSNYATVAEKKGAAALTDSVTIDFVGYMNGEVFEGGSATDYDLTLGSGSFIDGFEEGLVGAMPGDTVTLELTFPDPYPNNTEFSGKPVTFVVTVNRVLEQILPEYTDAFVKEYYGYETITAFETALRESMEAQMQSAFTYNRITQAWNTVMENSEVISYPEEELDDMYQQYVTYYTALAEQDNISLNEYAQNLGMTVKEFTDALHEEAESEVKRAMILYYIARMENISISDAEYQSGALEYANYYGLSSVEELETYFEPDQIRQNLLFDKVLEYIADQAIAK